LSSSIDQFGLINIVQIKLL